MGSKITIYLLVILYALCIEFCIATNDQQQQQQQQQQKLNEAQAGPSNEPEYMDFGFLQDLGMPPVSDSTFQHDFHEMSPQTQHHQQQQQQLQELQQQLEQQQQSPSTATPFMRSTNSPGLQQWEQLHMELFDEAIIDSTAAKVEQILIKMHNLEQSDDLRMAIQALNTQHNTDSRLRRYKILENTCYLHKIIAQPDQSLTETLLETFDQNSMDCSETNLMRLNQLRDTFQAEFTLYVSLTQNIDLQYQNCWQRYVSALQKVILLMSSREMEYLDQIRNNIHFPPVTKPYLVTADNAMQLIEMQLEQYVPAIALLINERYQFKIHHDFHHDETKSTTSSDATKLLISQMNLDYDRYIQEPCKRLISLGSQVQAAILSLIKLINNQKLYMKPDQVATINTFKMCQLVLTVQEMRKRTLSMLASSFPSNNNQMSMQNQQSAQKSPDNPIIPELITMQIPIIDSQQFSSQIQPHPNPSLVPMSKQKLPNEPKEMQLPGNSAKLVAENSLEAAQARDRRRNMRSKQRLNSDPTSHMDHLNRVYGSTSMLDEQQSSMAHYAVPMNTNPLQFNARPSFDNRPLPVQTGPGADSIRELRQRVKDRIPLKSKSPADYEDARVKKKKKANEPEKKP